MSDSNKLRSIAAFLVLGPPLTNALFGIGMAEYDSVMIIAAVALVGAVILKHVEQR